MRKLITCVDSRKCLCLTFSHVFLRMLYFGIYDDKANLWRRVRMCPILWGNAYLHTHFWVFWDGPGQKLLCKYRAMNPYCLSGQPRSNLYTRVHAYVYIHIVTKLMIMFPVLFLPMTFWHITYWSIISVIWSCHCWCVCIILIFQAREEGMNVHCFVMHIGRIRYYCVCG